MAVVGATGAVGQVMLQLLAQRAFPARQVIALASARSVGRRLTCGENEVVVQKLEDFDFKKADLALFSAGAAVSREYAPRAAARGCVVIDNTSCFRSERDIPLVVPEVNPEALAAYKQRHIIANPNCSTIQLVVVLKPIQEIAGLERINICTYQAVSGAGTKALQELALQSQDVLDGKAVKAKYLPTRIAFNALPQIDRFEPNGYTREEMKIVRETRRLLGLEDLRINPTAVRVPVFHGHSEAVHIETRRKLGVAEARELLARAPGVSLLDGRKDGAYPTAAGQAQGSDLVYVGRLREDISHPRGLAFWVVADNLRKGAALNSIQIAELLIRGYLNQAL